MFRKILGVVLVASLRLFGWSPGYRVGPSESIRRWLREKPREIDDGMTKSQINFPVELAGGRQYDKRRDIDLRREAMENDGNTG